MGKRILLCALGVMLCAGPASAFYEDFETTGDQYTLLGNQTITDGRVDPDYTWNSSAGLLDGDYPASAGNPVQITATWNMGGESGTWAMPTVGFGSDGTSDGGHWQGFIANALPNYNGGAGHDSFMIINGVDGWNDIIWQAGPPPDGAWDLNADYQTVVIDSGDSVDYWIQLASNPSIKSTTHTVDLTGWTRTGDKVYLNMLANNDGPAYFDDVRIDFACPVTVEHSDGKTAVAEKGETTDSFTVMLDEEPNATVILTLDPPTDDIKLNGAAPNEPITLTFETGNWDTPQTVTVMANDDNEGEGEETIRIDISAASTDIDFVCSASAPVTVLDDDQEGVLITESDAATEVAEEGMTTDTYEVVLVFPPNADVTITIDDASEPNQVLVNGDETATLTFTAADWDTPQTVTVKAIDDPDEEAHPHAASLSHSVSQPGGNMNYNGISVDNAAVTISENDCGAGPFNEKDYNEDCLVNVADFAEFVAEYLKCSIGFCP